jgi:hypothetical protein
MNADLPPALISGAIAIGAAGIAIWGQIKNSRVNHEFEKSKLQAESEKNVAKYSEPLVRAAADLQSRLFNILALNFVECFLVDGTPRERQYAISNTAFLFAQFFAWTEATRQEIQFIKLEGHEQTRKLSELQSSIYSILQTDKYAPEFRVFAGEQRAIGEKMLVQSAAGLRCMGYGEFISKGGFPDDPLLAALHSDVVNLGKNGAAAISRFVALQNALVELMDFLDPAYLRFPKAERSKYSLSPNIARNAR